MFGTHQLPSGRKGKIAAIAILALVGTIFWLLIAGPLYQDYSELAEARERRRGLLSLMEKKASRLPALREAAEQAAPTPAQTTFLTGSTTAIAGAKLQQAIKAAAASAGVTISSVETLAPDTNSLRKIPVRVVFETSWPGLLDLMVALTSQGLSLDDVRLRGSPTINKADVPKLEATWTVLGIWSGSE